MSNTISATGISIQTVLEVIEELTSYFKTIYGQDINVDSHTPDGQLIAILAQAKIDMLEFIVAVNDSFDPDVATGVLLDLRCAINGVKRISGSYSRLMASIAFSDATVLPGLDTSSTPFTIEDSAGNKWYLVSSVTITEAGSKDLEFRAATYGEYNPSLNSINIISTPMSGVLTCTNPTVPVVIGTARESDAALRLRRRRSVALPSKGWHEGLWADLVQSGIRDARIYENITGSVDANGVPAHGIWVVVDDEDLLSTDEDTVSTRALEIAQILYKHHNAGCDIKTPADTGFNIPITLQDGNLFHSMFDVPIEVPLYVRLTAVPLPNTVAISQTDIAKSIYNYFAIGDGRYKIGGAADASAILSYVKTLFPSMSFSGCEVSMDNVTWDTLIPIDNTAGRPVLQARWSLGDNYNETITIS